MNNKEIDDLFKQKLYDFEADVPNDCWDAIEQALPNKKVMPSVFMWRRIAVAAVLLLSVSLTGYWFLKNRGLNQKQIAVVTKPQVASSKQTIISPINSTPVKTEIVIALPKTTLLHADSKEKIANPIKEELVKDETKKQDLNPTEIAIVNAPTEIAQSTYTPQSASIDTAKAQFILPAKASDKEIEDFIRAGIAVAEAVPESAIKEGRASSLGLLAALPNIAKSTSNNEFHTLRSASNTADALTILNATQNNGSSSANSRRHSLPLSLGLMVNQEITNNLFIETGLRYTYLRSDQEQSGLPYYSNEIQKLHYLGVPLSLVYRFAEYRRFSFYANAGGMVEKNIAGTWLEEIKNNNKTVYSVLQRDLEDKLQWSVHYGMGANYRIGRWLNFYLEPSIAYFPDNNSKIDNIRKQQKLNVELQGGFRAVFKSR
jgi:hypothetical protein